MALNCETLIPKAKAPEGERIRTSRIHPGESQQKPQHQMGQGVVGLDLGPSTIAVVAEQEALLQPFCPELTPNCPTSSIV